MKTFFKPLIFVVLATICVPVPVLAAPDHHEEFARQYMPKSQAIFERFRKECAETCVFRYKLAEDLRVMCRKFDDDAAYCALSEKISVLERLEAAWAALVKDAFFRHTASMITAEIFEEKDAELAKAAVAWENENLKCFLNTSYRKIYIMKDAYKRSLITVKIPDSSFAIGKYEVTQAEYESVMKKNPSRFKGYNHPVENVTWNDAVEFCKKLTARERAAGLISSRQEYRLPTLEQWERACRAGTTTKYYTGDSEEDLNRAAWNSENSGSTTHPVGQKEPNAFGLYDMLGNVAEMTRLKDGWRDDWFGDSRLGERGWKKGIPFGGSYSSSPGWWWPFIINLDSMRKEVEAEHTPTARYMRSREKEQKDSLGFRVVLE